MTEDPYRWLEAIANRREYIRTQLAGGSPVFAASLHEGVLLLGVGTGQSKVFEVFDRQALAGLGHPADLERLRQAVIDAAHLEAFTRAPEDVSLRRLVSQGLGPQLKAAFEQIFAPPFLARLLLAEVGPEPSSDILVKLGFDGSFEILRGGVAVVADQPEKELPAQERLRERLLPDFDPARAAAELLREWPGLGESPGDVPPARIPPTSGARIVEAALLRRDSDRVVRYEPLDAAALGLEGQPPSPLA